jgi:hypothetical protein
MKDRKRANKALKLTAPAQALQRRSLAPVFSGRRYLGDALTDDRELARRALDLQTRGRDYRLNKLPGYMEWSNRKIDEGVSEALIAHLDATSMWLLPEEVAQKTEADYETLLQDLRDSLDDEEE